MADGLDFYVNLLSGDMSGLSAVGALRSMDSAANRATAGIQALEGQLASAKAKLDSLGASENIDALTSRLATARDQLSAIKSGKVPFDPKEYKRASDEVGRLGGQLDSAKAKQAASIDAQKSKIDALTGKIREQKEAHAQNAALNEAKRSLIKKGLDEQVSGLGRVLSTAQQAGGPIGSIASMLSSLGKGGAVGAVIAIAVALAAATTAAIVAAAALTRYAFAASDAARTSKLMSEAALGTGSAAWELETVVDQMSDVAPGLSAKLKEVGRSLAEVEIRGRDAQRTLNAFRIVAGSSGEQAAAKITSIAEASRMADRLILGARNRFGEFASLSGTGIKAADIYAAVAKSMRTSIPEAKRAVEAGLVPFKRGMEALELAAETKLGGNVAKQMMSLGNQAAKLKENVAKLFAGANIEPFLEGLKKITDLFDTNTVTGYVLREVMTAVFTKVAEVAAKVFPYVRAAIMGVVAGIVITADIAKRLYRVLSETFGGAGKNIDGMALAFKAGVAVVGIMVGSILGLTAAIVALGVIAAVALAPIWLPFALAAVLIYGVVSAITSVIDEAKSLGKELEGIDLAASAGKMIDGLVKGIQAKIGDVKNAILEVSGAITSAFNSDQEIRSPGRKPMRQGRDWGRGLVIGVERTAPMAERAALAVSNATTQGLAGESGGSAAPAPSTNSQPTFSFSGCTFGAVTQEQIEEMLAIAYTKMARGYAMGVS